MEQVGYSLIDANNVEIQYWGDTPGVIVGVPDVIRIDSDNVHGAKAGDAVGAFRLVPRMIAFGTSAGSSFDGTNLVVTKVITSAQVDAERDRRMRLFPYGGKTYDFDEGGQTNISGAGTLAFAAIINGAQSGNLRWADANKDFAWIAHDNSQVTMDAQTTWDFATKAAMWKSGHLFAGRALKDTSPIPVDYASDSYWPTGA